MHYKSVIATLFALMLGAAALAGEAHRMQVELGVEGDDSQGFRSADASFEFEKAGAQNGVTIISGNNMDAVTKQQIRDVLSSSGHTGEVTFVDGSGSHDDHAQRVHVITKEVDVTN